MGFKSGPTDGTEQGNPEKASTSPGDDESLSRSAEAKKRTNSLEESRKKRLNKVRRELEEGKYRVSAKDIARKLIDDNTK